jgi:MoxR-like ATPase
MENLIYTGTYLQKKNNALNLDVYNPSPELVDAVNLAILLEQPLLLMGEPGCGKTRLAEAVAAELHKEKYKSHFFRWDIKSTSKAKEGIYHYDALGRMYDANSSNPQAQNIEHYITYGKFTDAFTTVQNGDLPNVLLIDEIDKADIDFPNDLLLEIEKGELWIPELNKKIERKSNVLIFITSNRERELPPAFLRRCLYHYITFPDQEDLSNIITAKFNKRTDDILVRNAVDMFLDIREKLEGQFAENEKKPSTSELLEWFRVINYCVEAQNDKVIPFPARQFVEAIRTYEKGNIDTIDIPFQQVLLKTWESKQFFETN